MRSSSLKLGSQTNLIYLGFLDPLGTDSHRLLRTQTLSLWFRLFRHQLCCCKCIPTTSSLPSSKIHNWLCPSHWPQISMSGPAPWFDKSRLILAFGTEILGSGTRMIIFATAGLGPADLPKVLIGPLLTPNVPDVFFLDRHDF